MTIKSNNQRHLNSEILSILDEAKDAASNHEPEKVMSLLAVAQAYKANLSVDGDGFISEKVKTATNRNALVDSDDED